MRLAVSAFVICALVATALANRADRHHETLVGWSEDGTTYAVTGFNTQTIAEEGYFLEVRLGKTVVARWKRGDKEVPDDVGDKNGVALIDVTTWEPVKKYGLKKIDAAARRRFTAAFQLRSSTRRISGDRYACKVGGGWGMRRKSDQEVFDGGKANRGHCWTPGGGYLDKSGTHALITMTRTWRDYDDRTHSHVETRVRLVEIPTKIPASAP